MNGPIQITNRQFYFIISLMFIWERERERVCVSEGGAEREGDTESKADSRLWADVGLELMNHEIMTWTKVRRLTDWATQAPLNSFFNVFCLFCFWERVCMNERRKDRERGTENPKQAPCCQHRARCGALSYEPWDYDLSQNSESGA